MTSMVAEMPILGTGPESLRFEDVEKHYAGADGRSLTKAVDGVSFSLRRGTVLGILGESGSGKSTTARLLLGLVKPSSGRVLHEGQDIARLSPAALRAARRKVQFVSQDPYASFDPRYTIRGIVEEGLDIHGVPRSEWVGRISSVFQRVRLDEARLSAYPHHLSGGQLQRVSLARALVLEPRLLILDEPLSALDLSTQDQVLSVLMTLRASGDCDYVFISHDIAVTALFCDYIAVMRAGRIVEIAPSDTIVNAARHPYSRSLIDASLDLRARTVPTTNPALATVEQPGSDRPLRPIGPDHWAAT